MARKNEATQNETKRIEVFRPGTFTAMGGMSFSATAQELADLAERYDPDQYPVPVFVGHPKSDDPAFGWVQSFSFDEDADKLFADVGKLEPQFSDAVEDGRYKRISMSFYQPSSTANPMPGQLYPKHVGFLGAAAPAVPGLKPVEFSDDDDAVTIEFADPAFRDVAGLLRKLREWIISKEGTEEADNVLPNWTIGWIEDAGSVETDVASSDFSQNEEDDDMANKVKKPNGQAAPSGQSGDQEVSFAEREAELDARQAALDVKEADQRHKDHVSFAEGLINDGKLPSGNKSKVVALLDGAACQAEDAIEFSDGTETKTSNLVSLLKDVLSGQPKIIEFGETEMSDTPNGEEPDPQVIADEALSFQVSQRDAGIEVSTSDAVSHVRKKRGLDT
ncbi:MAG: hypothetical protein N4A65_01025 [Cohaesibacter sp.]|nr:hypothetical protein [Cohaesibacter sp.]